MAEPHQAQKETDAEKQKKEIEYWRNQFGDLMRSLEDANENGLMKGKSPQYDEIVGIIASGLESLSSQPPKPIEARGIYSKAYFKFNEQANSAGFWWRFKYWFGGPALAYLLSSFALLLLIWIFFLSNSPNFNVFWVPGWAFLWGAMGGSLQGFWVLWRNVSDRDFRNVWYLWYLLLPLMGAVLGAFAYLIFFAGFIAFTGGSQIGPQFFAMLLSALAGFSSKWAVSLLDKLTQIIQIKG